MTKLKTNLQYFAEGDPEPEVEPESETITMTKEEYAKGIESESDRKMAKTLEKKQKEWEKEFAERVKTERDEAEKLAKLSQKERDDVEYQKKIDALTERENALAKQELRSSVVTELNEKQLPASFADFLLGNDADATFKNIGEFKTTFDEAVNQAVKESLRQDTPKGSTGQQTDNDPFKQKMAKYK